MKFKNNEGDTRWKEFESNNMDSYGSGVVRFARAWAELMETQMGDEFKPELAESTSNEADTEGITGFMYGCAVGNLAEMWIWGDQLKKWYNKQYGKEDAQGVVNPAVFILK